MGSALKGKTSQTKKIAFILEPCSTASQDILSEVAEVKLGHADRRYSEDELIKEAQGVDVLLITSRDGVSRKVMEQCKKLKAIVKCGAKPSNVDLQAATEMGIAVCWTPGSNTVSVAEHTLMMILALQKRLVQSMSAQKNGKWRHELTLCREFYGKTVGVIGLGLVGVELAKRLSCFNVGVIGYDPYITKERAEQLKVRIVSLNELLRVSDVVTLHCELNKETEHFIGMPQLKQMKRSAYLVNTARGELIDTEALHSALKEGIIAGAALDVFEGEPTKADNPLFSLENVLFTPHMAGITYEALERDFVWAAEEAVRILKGEPAKNTLNPEYIKKMSRE